MRVAFRDREVIGMISANHRPLTGQNCDCHGSVHEEQHVEEQESQIAKYFGTVISDIIIQRAD